MLLYYVYAFYIVIPNYANSSQKHIKPIINRTKKVENKRFFSFSLKYVYFLFKMVHAEVGEITFLQTKEISLVSVI